MRPFSGLKRVQKVASSRKVHHHFLPEAVAVALKLSDSLVEDAKVVGAAEHRSVPKQIEHWARIGKAVLENPDVPLQVIQDTMLSLEEAKAGQLAPYAFG